MLYNKSNTATLLTNQNQATELYNYQSEGFLVAITKKIMPDTFVLPSKTKQNMDCIYIIFKTLAEIKTYLKDGGK